MSPPNVDDPNSIDLTDRPDGCRLRLRVRAGARRDGIVGVHGGALKIAVTAPPERGRANRAVLELLAEALGLPPSRLRIVAGEISPDKVVLVEGVTAQDCSRRLAQDRLTRKTRSER